MLPQINKYHIDSSSEMKHRIHRLHRDRSNVDSRIMITSPFGHCGTFWDNSNDFLSLEHLDYFHSLFRLFSPVIGSLKKTHYGRTHGRRDRPCYWDAWTHLKTISLRQSRKSQFIDFIYKFKCIKLNLIAVYNPLLQLPIPSMITPMALNDSMQVFNLPHDWYISKRAFTMRITTCFPS